MRIFSMRELIDFPEEQQSEITGDVKPDEKELFALENGKHFYIVSLEDFKQKMRVTLPRYYEAIDVYGSYSEDGKILYVPVYKYVSVNI